MGRHILPNLVGTIIVYGTLTVPAAILSESFLSFLGLGVQPPLPELGQPPPATAWRRSNPVAVRMVDDHLALLGAEHHLAARPEFSWRRPEGCGGDAKGG